MRQGFADFGRDERMLPVAFEIGVRKRDWFGVVVEERDTNFFAKGWIESLQKRAEFGREGGEGKLCAERLYILYF
jgi:hypothetical protein